MIFVPLALCFLASLLLSSLSHAWQSAAKVDSAKRNGLYIAVGYGGRRIRSLNGLKWENDSEWAAEGGDDNNCLFSVASGKGRFIAVGGGASQGHVLMTRDGKAWKEVYTARTRVVPVVYGSGRFTAGSGRDFLVSPDGETWTTGGHLEYERGLYFRRATFGNGVFVFCGDVDIAPDQPRGGWRAATTDGVKVEAFVTNLPNTRSIAFGAGKFVLVGEHGYRAVSTNGTKWDTKTDDSEDFRWVFWTGKQFILGGKAVYVSPDGVTWTKTDKNIPCEPQCGGPDGYIGVSWKTNLWQSPDGLAWQRVSQDGTNAFTSVVYGQSDLLTH